MSLDRNYAPRLGAIRNGESVPLNSAALLQRLRSLGLSTGIFLVIEIIYIALTSPRMAVKIVELKGDPGVTAVIAREMQLPENLNIFRAHTRALISKIEHFPAVKKVSLVRDFPDRLVVTIEQREAVAVIRRAEQARLVDPDGVIFTIPNEWGWGLPELAGAHLQSDKVETPEAKAEISRLLTVMRILGPDPRLRAMRIAFENEDDIVLTLDSGAKVRLGSAQQLDIKAKLLAAAVERLGAEKVGYLDLSDPATAYWRPRGAMVSAVMR